MVLVMAAGRGERFSVSGGTGNKLDAKLCGRPMLAHVLDAVRAAGLKSFLVGPQDAAEGIGESIARGVKATAHAPAWIILPGDVPLIKPGTIRQVAEALVDNSIVVPQWRSRNGHPLGFGREHFSELTSLHRDTGAHTVVVANKRRGKVFGLAVEDVGAVLDVNTHYDLTLVRTMLQAQHQLHADY